MNDPIEIALKHLMQAAEKELRMHQDYAALARERCSAYSTALETYIREREKHPETRDTRATSEVAK